VTAASMPAGRRPLAVLGITGCTRSGKSRVAEGLRVHLGLPAESIVGQDQFWSRAVRLRLPTGQEVVSEEEPECTDHGAFADAIRAAISTAALHTPTCVIAEGFQLLHDTQVLGLLDHVFFLDLDRDECIARRSAPRSSRNPNPMSSTKCETLVWPAHERYVESKVSPLGSRVQWLKPPSSADDVSKVVEAICETVGLLKPGDVPGQVAETDKTLQLETSFQELKSRLLQVKDAVVGLRKLVQSMDGRGLADEVPERTQELHIERLARAVLIPVYRRTASDHRAGCPSAS